MKIWAYLQITPEKFRTDYVDTRLVDVATHPTFPLEMLTYGREAVHTNNWDSVIRKCRGIIFNVETDDIIARPFEKFFNLKTAGMPETDPSAWVFDTVEQMEQMGEPEVWEKMDGFLCTAYEYRGQAYIASKGSFDSVHAKWATNWYRNWMGEFYLGAWPTGYTPVFEGICSSIRIVVDYEDFEGLVLLALVNIETGEELPMAELQRWAARTHFETPDVYDLTWQGASAKSLDVNDEFYTNFEGVSAKVIYRGLSDPAYKGELREWIDESTPWFSKFVSKWVRSLTTRHDELLGDATRIFAVTQEKLKQFSLNNWDNPAAVRKAYAEAFNQWPDVKGILFAMYDGKDASAVAWKLTKPMIKDSHPMLNASILR